jgi:hypothetical protein
MQVGDLVRRSDEKAHNTTIKQWGIIRCAANVEGRFYVSWYNPNGKHCQTVDSIKCMDEYRLAIAEAMPEHIRTALLEHYSLVTGGKVCV